MPTQKKRVFTGAAVIAMAVGLPTVMATVGGSPAAYAAGASSSTSSSLTGQYGSCTLQPDGTFAVTFTVTNNGTKTVSSYANGQYGANGTITWSGSYTVPAGGTASGIIPFPASVKGTTVKVAVDYAQTGDVRITHWTNVQCGTPVTPPPPACQHDLSGVIGTTEISADGRVTYTATLPKPACSNLTAFGDTYLLPPGYDGSGNFDSSASPQFYVPSARAALTIAKGRTSAMATGSVASGLKCGDNWVQPDVYRGPQQNTVTYPQGSNGWIAGGPRKVVVTAGKDCTPVQPPAPNPPKPTVTVTYGKWTGPMPDCDHKSVTQTRGVTTTTTTYKEVWDEKTQKWVPIVDKVTTADTTQTRVVHYTGTCKPTPPPVQPPAPNPPKPTVTVTYGKWTGPMPDCDHKSVTQTRGVTTTTTTYKEVWDEKTQKWVPIVDKVTTADKKESRAEHYAGKACTPNTPPTKGGGKHTAPPAAPKPKPSVNPTTKVTGHQIVTDGGSSSSGGLTGGDMFLIVTLGGGLAFAGEKTIRRLRRR